MTRYHINPETRAVGICRAKSPETCKFGGMHFDSFKKAQKYNDEHNSKYSFNSARKAMSTKSYSDEELEKLKPPLIAKRKEVIGKIEYNGEENYKVKDMEEVLGIAKIENPDFSFIDHSHSNPNYSTHYGYEKYRVNCQCCVVAFELRCRGYDVEAKGNDNLSSLALSRCTELAYIDPETNDCPKKQELKSQSPAALYKELQRTIKENERYTFEFAWKGRGTAGHIVNIYKSEDGELVIYDPQISYISKGEEVAEYLKHLKFKKTVQGFTYKIPPQITRVDNMDIRARIAEEVLIVNKTEENSLDNKKKGKTNKKANKPKKKKPESNVKLPEMLTKFATKQDLMTLQEEYSDKELNEMFKDIKDPLSFVNKMNELLKV